MSAELSSTERLRRIFEPMPIGEQIYHKGDTVRLIRPLAITEIPVGCLGVVIQIHSPETAPYERGRPFYVKFNVEGYRIPLSFEYRQAFQKAGVPVKQIPVYHIHIGTDVGPNDIEPE